MNNFPTLHTFVMVWCILKAIFFQSLLLLVPMDSNWCCYCVETIQDKLAKSFRKHFLFRPFTCSLDRLRKCNYKSLPFMYTYRGTIKDVRTEYCTVQKETTKIIQHGGEPCYRRNPSIWKTALIEDCVKVGEHQFA